MSRTAAGFYVFLFSFFSIFFPVLIINKIAFLVIIMALAVAVFTGARFEKMLSPLLIVSFFSIGFVISLISDSDAGLARQFFLIIFALFFIYYINYRRVNLENILYISLFLMAFSTVVIAALSYLNLLPFFFKVLFEKYSLGVVSSRELAGVLVPMVHFGAAPALFVGVVVACCCISRKGFNLGDGFCLAFILVAIILSSSRALILLSFLYLFFALYFNSGLCSRVVLFFLLVLSLFFGLDFLVMNFSSADRSNSVKIGHVLGFIDHFNWYHVFWGDGLAAYYYSYGVDRYVSHTEITLLDQIRYLGLLPVIIIYCSLLVPGIVFAFNKGDSILLAKLCGFSMYLILSLTNPVLFNSFGVLVILWWWSVLFKSKGDYKYA